MSQAGRGALIALGVLLLMPGACSALAVPFIIGIFPSLFSDKPEEYGLSAASLGAWGLGALSGGLGVWLLVRLRKA